MAKYYLKFSAILLSVLGTTTWLSVPVLSPTTLVQNSGFMEISAMIINLVMVASGGMCIRWRTCPARNNILVPPNMAHPDGVITNIRPIFQKVKIPLTKKHQTRDLQNTSRGVVRLTVAQQNIP